MTVKVVVIFRFRNVNSPYYIHEFLFTLVITLPGEPLFATLKDAKNTYKFELWSLLLDLLTSELPANDQCNMDVMTQVKAGNSQIRIQGGQNLDE